MANASKNDEVDYAADYEPRSLWFILRHIPKIYYERLTFGVVEAVSAKREIYYSTVFALSSAALAFLGTLINKEYGSKWLLLLSVVSFGFAILLIIFIHFIQSLYLITSKFYSERAEPSDMFAIISGKKKSTEIVWHSINDGIELMGLGGKLDIALIVVLSLGIISYVLFLSLNTF